MVAFRFVHADARTLPGDYQNSLVVSANLPRVGENVVIEGFNFAVVKVIHVFPSTAGQDVLVLVKDAD